MTQEVCTHHSCWNVLQGMAFGWELTMTFLLVAVVYAVAIGQPSFVETGPLAVGFTLWASASVGVTPRKYPTLHNWAAYAKYG